MFARAVSDGTAKRDPARGPLDVAPMVLTAVDDDLDVARDAVRRPIALYVGAFGSREANFYKSLVERYGFEPEAAAIQDAMLDGKPSDAVAAVTDAMVDALALAGPVGRVRERLQAYVDAGATSVLAMTTEAATIRDWRRRSADGSDPLRGHRRRTDVHERVARGHGRGIARFCELSGDFNVLHTDDEAAREAGFRGTESRTACSCSRSRARRPPRPTIGR